MLPSTPTDHPHPRYRNEVVCRSAQELIGDNDRQPPRKIVHRRLIAIAVIVGTISVLVVAKFTPRAVHEIGAPPSDAAHLPPTSEPRVAVPPPAPAVQITPESFATIGRSTATLRLLGSLRSGRTEASIEFVLRRTGETSSVVGTLYTRHDAVSVGNPVYGDIQCRTLMLFENNPQTFGLPWHPFPRIFVLNLNTDETGRVNGTWVLSGDRGIVTLEP